MNPEKSLDSLISSIKATATNQPRRKERWNKKKSWVNNDSQKDTSLANLKRSKDAIDIPKNPDITESIFEGKKFMIIPYGSKMPAKRIEILSQNIAKKGGIVSPHSTFHWDPTINSDVSIIASDELNYEAIERMIPAIFHNDISFFTFIDCEWVTLCLQKNRWIHPAPYFLKLEGLLTTTPAEPTKEMIQKIKKLGSGDEVNKVNPKIDPKIDTIVKEKYETKIPEKQEGVSTLNSLTTMNSLQSAISQKEPDMDYKPYSYLFDYLYEPKQMDFLESEETSSDPIQSQTSILTPPEDQNRNEYLDIIGEEEEEEIDEEIVKKKEEEHHHHQQYQQAGVLSEHIQEPPTSKKEEYFKSETFPKTEYHHHRIKNEHSGVKSEYKGESFTYILSDDDDDVIFEGQQKRKPKLEEEDVKGTFLEEVDLERINTNQEGEVSELKDFKTYRPSLKRVEPKKVERQSSKDHRILLCQPEAKTNLNIHLTDELERLLKIYQIQKDKGRVYAYGKAISLLKAFPKKIESSNDAKNVLGLGDGMLTKIQEILNTGTLQRAENMSKTDQMKVLELFDDIHGVGPATALQFYNKGFRTIDDLKKNSHLLNYAQKVGVKYYDQFKQKIPREFVTEVFNFVASKVEELSDYKGQYEVLVGGSYRRGRAYCGDIDIMMSPKDGGSSQGFCLKLIKSLEGIFLTDHLQMPHPNTLTGETYLGVCYFKGLHRRIDFKVVDRERFGPLIVFYTGGDYFNRSMRLFATKKGYHLENYGLYPAVKAGNEKYALNLIPCYTEHDVFKVLGLKYVPPEERDV